MSRSLLAIVACAVACGPRASDTDTPGGFAVDAAGRPAIVERRWTLDGKGTSIGVVFSMVRCRNVLFVGDTQGGIRRLRLDTGDTLPTIADGALAMALAVDCDGGVIYGYGPAGRTFRSNRGYSLRRWDIESGLELTPLAVDAAFAPAVAGSVVDGAFVLGGLWTPPPLGERVSPTPATFYRDSRIGIVLDLATGTVLPTPEPYDLVCRGGGRCVGGSLFPVRVQGTVRWLAAQPASRLVALYDSAWRRIRTFDISSPLFMDDGRTVEVSDAEASMRWSTANSVVRMSIPFGAMVATVHSLIALPPDYVFGQSVDFDWWMNLHTLDGRGLVSDISLPGWPAGWDDDSVYTVDYGPGGRTAAPDSVRILRIPIRTGSAGFEATNPALRR